MRLTFGAGCAGRDDPLTIRPAFEVHRRLGKVRRKPCLAVCRACGSLGCPSADGCFSGVGVQTWGLRASCTQAGVEVGV
jgi:hypothetical protein